MLTKLHKDDYYVINRMNLNSSEKQRIKSNIHKKSEAKIEITKLAKKLGCELSKSGYFSCNGYYYGVEFSNKELDKALKLKRVKI